METTVNKQSRFHMSIKTKKIAADLISYLFVALFVYTAASKVLTFSTFEKVIGKSVVFGDYKTIVAWSVIVIEIVISVLLIAPKTRKIGLFASLGLMTLFTIYLIYMISSGNKLGCSCGGFISELSWKGHVWFNIAFIILAVTGLKFYKEE